MKQVFEQYASAIIAVLLASTLVVVIWTGSFFQGKGIPQVLGQVLDYSIGEKSIMKNTAFEHYMDGAAPMITEREGYVVADERISLSDCFEAKSKKGTILPVFLKKAWNLEGTEVDMSVSTDRTTICVADAGIYWIQIYTVDENQKECSRITKLLVNER